MLTSSDVAPLLDITGLSPAPRVLALDTLAGPALDAPVPVSPDATALLQFTSGSTASPKGVVLPQHALLANVRSIAGPDGLDTCTDDVAVSWLPLYHDMGLIGMLLTTVWGGNFAVIMSPVLFLKRPTVWLKRAKPEGRCAEMEHTLWSAALSLVSAIILLWVNSVNNENKRLSILLSKTREENAEKYVTKNDVHNDINRVLARLDRLDEKLDAFMKEQRSAIG